MSAVAALSSNVSFQCNAVGNVVWEINGRGVLSQLVAQNFAGINIFAPLPTSSNSEVIIAATQGTNGTSVQCLVRSRVETEVATLNMSDVATLLVVGEGE